jgi:hypothetical protein
MGFSLLLLLATEAFKFSDWSQAAGSTRRFRQDEGRVKFSEWPFIPSNDCIEPFLIRDHPR